MILSPDVLKIAVEEYIPFQKFLGVEYLHSSEGFLRMRLPFRTELIGNPLKPAIHGGVLSFLIDSVGGAAVFTIVPPMQGMISTVDMRVDYLRPAKAQDLIAEGRVIRRGRHLVVTSMVVMHEVGGAPIAEGKGVYMINQPKTSKPEQPAS